MYGSIYEFITINKNIKTLRYQGIILSYIIISFLILFQLKFQNQSEIKLLILLLHVWSSDVGGYIMGKSIGKHFITKISPKKTWEGVIGSILFCIIISFILNNEMKEISKLNHYLTSIILCLSSISGDFIISWVKRINNKKDSGYFLPGHGGFLDRLDSLLLTNYIFILLIN